MSEPTKSCLIFFSFWFSCLDFCFLLWWKIMDGPWSTVWWECASISLSLPLYWTFRAYLGKQWSFTGVLSNQLPQVIHLQYIAMWNQLPKDGGGVTSTAGHWMGISYYYMPWTLFFWDPIGISFLMEYWWWHRIETQSVPQRAHCLTPQYTLFGTGWVSMPKGASRNVYSSFDSCTRWTPSSASFTA